MSYIELCIIELYWAMYGTIELCVRLSFLWHVGFEWTALPTILQTPELHPQQIAVEVSGCSWTPQTGSAAPDSTSWTSVCVCQIHYHPSWVAPELLGWEQPKTEQDHKQLSSLLAQVQHTPPPIAVFPSCAYYLLHPLQMALSTNHWHWNLLYTLDGPPALYTPLSILAAVHNSVELGTTHPNYAKCLFCDGRWVTSKRTVVTTWTQMRL